MKKQKKLSPFDVFKSIQNLEYLEDISPVNRYMLDQIISAYPEFVHAVNNLNKIGNHILSKRAIYDYYYHCIGGCKGYAPYPKKQKDENVTKYLQDYFNVKEGIAKQYMSLMSQEDLSALEKMYEDFKQ